MSTIPHQIWENRKLGAKCREAEPGNPNKRNLFGGTSHLHPFAPKNLLDVLVLQGLLLWLPQKLQLLEKKDVIYQILRPQAVISRLL